MRHVQRFRRRARLGLRRLGEVVFSVNQSMPTRPPFDLPQAIQVSTFEVSTSVLEFPERAIWIASVENVALWKRLSDRVLCNIHQQFFIPLWNPYMFSWRTNEDIFVCLKYCL